MNSVIRGLITQKLDIKNRMFATNMNLSRQSRQEKLNLYWSKNSIINGDALDRRQFLNHKYYTYDFNDLK